MTILRFQDHFRARRTEWMLAAIMVVLGLFYLFAPPLFTAEHFGIMRQWAGQATWGAGILMLGLFRLTMLYINGA